LVPKNTQRSANGRPISTRLQNEGTISGGFKGEVGAATPLLDHRRFFKKPLFLCKRHIFRCSHLR